LRLGLLSHEFRANVVGHFLRHLPAAFDRERVVVEAFVYNPDDGSAIRRDLLAGCDQVHDLTTVSITEAAAGIAARGIQILIDINPYMEGGRPEIAALRPAPIQLSYLYPGTSGAPWIDGLLIDEIVVPPAQAGAYSEALLALPPSYLPATGRAPIATDCPPRAHYGLPESGVVLGCFNRADKLDPETFAAWLRILAAVPEAVLWLSAEAAIVQRLRTLAQREGIDPARLIAVAHEPEMAVHLARHRHADLFLDTFIHGAHVTAADALWAGLPVLTRLGETYAGRVAASLLTAAGLSELIAVDTEDYVRRAIALAGAPEALSDLRADWAARRADHPLFDPRATAAALEALLERLWAQRDASPISALPAQPARA
jgi:predicted O-linked N-acetylglucosamine transferase (SPINDLY family)